MKKILLVTSALVAASSIAVAGDMPAAAPTVAGFTMTATGYATIFGYYNDTAVVAPDTEYGIGAEFEGTIEAAKTLDDGSDVYVNVVFYNGDDTEVLVGYKSSIGEFKAGVIDEDGHDIEAPSMPDIPGVGDELGDGDQGLTFASADLSLYKDFSWDAAGHDLTSADYSVTYTSAEFSGFQIGTGVDGEGNIDLAIAGAFAAGDATVKIGARYIATRLGGLDTGAATVGASAEIAGFIIAGDFTADLDDETNNAFTVGAQYATGPFIVGMTYEAVVDSSDKGLIAAGVQYNDGGLIAIVDGTYSLIDTGAAPDAWTAAAGATYAFTSEVTVGATILASGNSAAGTDTVFTASAGVDYALNSNVTIGAGFGYDGSTEIFGAAVGMTVTF